MSDDWTMECWIKRDPDNHNRPLISNVTQTGLQGHSVAITKEMWDKLDPNKWHHVSAVRDMGNVKMYVDGKRVDTATVTRRADGKFTLEDYQTKLVFPDRETMIVHIAKMRILRPDIEIVGDVE